MSYLTAVTSRKMHTWKWMAFDHGDGLLESGAENYCGKLVLRLLSQVMYLGYLLCFLHAKWPSLRNGWLTLEHGCKCMKTTCSTFYFALQGIYRKASADGGT
ncbi:hypothetical protein EUGRSUZ_A00819 [Eucalyptus grandis]|uniref:Uncharacterized protein n=3 Tax=Eucalyptus grandis TaxID=71139 RepID=A0A059DCH9_EUCGR|nr:hypothetical protein EUGRSUZ_A00819 [Eucalyptus grandis]KAK3444741.1 hypothetical protein EUGRSUZ_A00819 [Eucalyptus grandis]